MDELDLSLALLSSESDMVSRKKRKQKALQEAMARPAAIDLPRLNDPLPLDWEQCLDLQSGRMYYLNRRQNLKRSWSRPEEQKLELDLNVTEKAVSVVSSSPEDDDSSSSSNYNMVAVVCVHCHLLVMICRSSPCCPNCKSMNNSLSTASQSGHLAAPAKTLKTLSLLH